MKEGKEIGEENIKKKLRKRPRKQVRLK